MPNLYQVSYANDNEGKLVEASNPEEAVKKWLKHVCSSKYDYQGMLRHLSTYNNERHLEESMYRVRHHDTHHTVYVINVTPSIIR